MIDSHSSRESRAKAELLTANVSQLIDSASSRAESVQCICWILIFRRNKSITELPTMNASLIVPPILSWTRSLQTLYSHPLGENKKKNKKNRAYRKCKGVSSPSFYFTCAYKLVAPENKKSWWCVLQGLFYTDIPEDMDCRQTIKLYLLQIPVMLMEFPIVFPTADVALKFHFERELHIIVRFREYI